VEKLAEIEIAAMLDTKIKKLLHILSDGEVHSGAALAETLKITRSAVWKLIHQLQEKKHLEIEAKTNQGYRLNGHVDLLDIHKIRGHLSQRYHPYLDKTLIFDEISSTNTYLLEQAQNKNNETYICLAEMQTAGRGRFNRQWISPFGSNIYLSLLWKFSNDLEKLSGLSLMIAVAILRALKKYGVKEKIEVKWPNDLYWQGRKLAGTLVELRGEFHHCYDAVIGIGLNIHVPEKLIRKADFPLSHLAEVTQSKHDRNRIIGLLLEETLDALAIFQEQGLKPFMKEFETADMVLNKSVKIKIADKTIQGTGRGIDEQGHFLLEDKKGKLQKFLCGEASLRTGA
jgi:BirA family biotin operon repressor/biotin-[acetyl-CoA-carboxylase] ligase